jgi:hypothetical protein
LLFLTSGAAMDKLGCGKSAIWIVVLILLVVRVIAQPGIIQHSENLIAARMLEQCFCFALICNLGSFSFHNVDIILWLTKSSFIN